MFVFSFFPLILNISEEFVFTFFWLLCYNSGPTSTLVTFVVSPSIKNRDAHMWHGQIEEDFQGMFHRFMVHRYSLAHQREQPCPPRG